MYVKWFTDFSCCGGWLPCYPSHCVKTALVYVTCVFNILETLCLHQWVVHVMSDVTGHFLYTLLRALCPCLRQTMEGTICGAVHLRSFSAVFYFFVHCASAGVC